MNNEITLAIAVGMNAAAYVAKAAGHPEAFLCIQSYREQWEAAVRPSAPRQMVRADIMPPDAVRYAVEHDFA